MPGDDLIVNIAIGNKRIERVNLQKIEALLPELELKIVDTRQGANLIMEEDLGATHVVLDVDYSKKKEKINKKKKKEIIDRAIKVLLKKQEQNLL